MKVLYVYAHKRSWTQVLALILTVMSPLNRSWSTVIHQYICSCLCGMHKLISVFKYAGHFLFVWAPSSGKPIVPGASSWLALVPGPWVKEQNAITFLTSLHWSSSFTASLSVLLALFLSVVHGLNHLALCKSEGNFVYIIYNKDGAKFLCIFCTAWLILLLFMYWLMTKNIIWIQ